MSASRSAAPWLSLTFGAGVLATIAFLLLLLRDPNPLWSVLAFAAWLWSTAVMALHWRAVATPRRLSRAVLVLILLLASVQGIGLVRVAGREDDFWRGQARTHLEEGARIAVEAMEALEREARHRAEQALAENADLKELAGPVFVAGSRLEVGVSIWRGGEILDWAGEVPGPDRPAPDPLPLIVDHGFRRYLMVVAEAGDGRVAFVDVSLGVTRDLFPRLGVGEEPGRPLSRQTGLTVRVLAQPPGPEEVSRDLDRVVGISVEEPWVWLALGAPSPREERRAALETRGRQVALSLLVAMAWGLILAWRRWPREGGRWGFAAALTAVLLLGAARWVMDRAGVLDLAFGDAMGSLGLLLEPAYFATTRGLGLLRNVLGFLMTSIVLMAIAVLLMPAWLALLQPSGSRLRRLLGFVLVLAASHVSLGWFHSLQTIVAQNANPKLVGLDAPFFTTPFVVLHLAMLLALLAPTSWVLLGWERWLRGSRQWGLAAVIAAGAFLLAEGLMQGKTLTLSVWGALLPVLGLLISPAVRDVSFARRVVAGLVATLWLAGLQSQGLEQVYVGLKESVARDEAEERLDPQDNWRRLVLEDLLRELAQDRAAAFAALLDPGTDRSNAAFELWAGSSLSDFGYGSRVEILGEGGRVISEFDLGLPYESRPARSWWPDLEPGAAPFQVRPVELVTDQGPFLVYRGVLHLRGLLPGSDVIALVVDLPYAAHDPATSIDLAPTGPAALGFPAARELAPRRELERPVIIGRLGPERVEAASDPALIGLARDELAPGDQWLSLQLEGHRYRVSRVSDGQGTDLVVAFVQPALAERVLDASRLIALYVLFGAVALLATLVIRGVRARPRRTWPQLLGQFGFQERLLGAIVLLVLLPVIVSGVFHQRRTAARNEQENLQEVARRLDTAVHLLASSLDDMATALIGGEYVQEILRYGNTTARRDVGPFELSQVMVFGPDGELILDETLRDFSPQAARAFFEEVRGGRMVIESDGRGWSLGRLYPVPGAGGRPHHVFVRRQLTDEDLGRLARIVGADLTLYDGPWAVVSSQDYLYKAGLLTPVLQAGPADIVLRGGSRSTVQAEDKAGLMIARGFVRVAGPGTEARGVLSARLFTWATEAAREQRRAQLFLLGLSSLAFVLAVAVGLLVAARIVDPIQTLVAATRRVGSGDLEVHLPEQGRDEIGQLVHSFNQMTGELRQSQRTLAARRRFLEAVLGNLSAGVLVIDASLQVREANASARGLLEGRQEEMLQRIVAMGPPRELLATEITLPAARGPRTLRVVVDPIQLESGDPGWLVLFDDVTELLASRRLALYAEMARQVAHEVKNPLTPIQLAAQMVRQACEDDHPRLRDIVEDSVSQIEVQVGRLRGIASEFSLLGRSDLPDQEPLPLANLLRQVQGQYPSADGTLEIRTHLEEEGLTAFGSREALLKVLSNLVENAIQAMGGRGALDLSAARDGDHVVVRVADDGPGIPPDVEDRLFQPYFSTKSTGTGLGLVICRNLMEKMGGSIRLENRPHQAGAVAILHLNAASPQARNDS